VPFLYPENSILKMKKVYLLLVVLVAGMGVMRFLPGFFSESEQKVDMTGKGFKDGDLIFQTSVSAQSMAIQLATHSSYSHCGILFKEDGEWWVFEAVQPVGRCRLKDWTRRGKENVFVVKRLKQDEVLTKQVLDSMRSIAGTWFRRDFDPFFEWSDARLYCSELIWKLYERTTGLQIGELQQLQDLDLSAPQVQEIMYARYKNNPPMSEKLITPVAMFRSPLLETVSVNGKPVN